MSILTTVLGGVASIASGGVLGVFGAVASGVVDIYKTRETNKQQLAVISAQKDLAIAEGSNQAKLEMLKLIGGSYESDKETYVNTKLFSIDGFRGTFRPAICWALFFLSCYVTWTAFKKVSLTDVIWMEIAVFAVYTTLNLSATCISWWFGSRQMDQLRRK